MFLFIIIPILVSGFVFINTDKKQSLKLHRFDGQYLYLKCITFGSIYVCMSSLICFTLYSLVPEHLAYKGISLNPHIVKTLSDIIEVSKVFNKEYKEPLAWFFVISILSGILAYFFSIIRNTYFAWLVGSSEKATLFLTGKLISDSPIDHIFFLSNQKELPIIITLDNSKVYVGIVVKLAEPNESKGFNQEIAIIPIISGYRDKETHEVEFTTDYDQVSGNFEIIIKQDKIVTASWFDFDVYTSFRNIKSKPKSDSFFRRVNASHKRKILFEKHK